MTDSEVAVEAHRRENERSAGQRHDLAVEQHLAEDGAQYPRLVERHEQHLYRHSQ